MITILSLQCLSIPPYTDINDVALFKLNQYMRRSASMQGIIQSPLPQEPKPAQMRTDTLPSRMAARRYSSRQLPKPPQPQEPAQLTLLRVQNATLRAENERLRRELSSLSSSPQLGVMRTEEKGAAYREIIRNKFTSRTKTSRITTECETALLSSKEISMQRSQLALDQLYENYLNSHLPNLDDLHEIVEKFFKDYCQNYAKIKVLFSCINTNKMNPQYQKLNQMMELYKVPLLYQKSPQILFRELSKSKQKGKIKKQKEKDNKEEMCLQVLSPQETVVKFEGLLQKLCRSSQMIRLLGSNEHVMRFISKIQSCKPHR